jgi:hypothetical protein
MEEIRRPLAGWLGGAVERQDATTSGIVKLAMLSRAASQHGAVGLLLAADHVDDALILTRSLFELLLHAEELVREPRREEELARRILRFAQVQDYLEIRELQQYRVESGRAPATVLDELEEMERDARTIYPEFSYTDKKGKHRWVTSWCNKTVAKLAEESSNPKRVLQYRTLYAKGSRLVHASPSAIIATAYAVGTAPDLVAIARQREKIQAQQVRFAASFSSIFLGEIFTIFGHRIPGFEPAWAIGTVGRLVRTIILDDA